MNGSISNCAGRSKYALPFRMWFGVIMFRTKTIVRYVVSNHKHRCNAVKHIEPVFQTSGALVCSWKDPHMLVRITIEYQELNMLLIKLQCFNVGIAFVMVGCRALVLLPASSRKGELLRRHGLIDC